MLCDIYQIVKFLYYVATRRMSVAEIKTHWGRWQVPSGDLPVAAFIETLTEPVDTRANTATCCGCVRRGLGRKMPFSLHGNIAAVEDGRRPNIDLLQLNTERLIASKISVIEHLGHKDKALVIIFRQTHCSMADKLVIRNFSLVGSTLSRKHGFATFVLEQLDWTLFDQPPEQSETECLCVYTSQDIRLLRSTNRHPSDSRQPHPYVPTPSLYAGDFNCQHVNWGFNTTFPDGESLVSWEAANNLELLHIRSTMKQEQPLQRMKLRPDRRWIDHFCCRCIVKPTLTF